MPLFNFNFVKTHLYFVIAFWFGILAKKSCFIFSIKGCGWKIPIFFLNVTFTLSYLGGWGVH